MTQRTRCGSPGAADRNKATAAATAKSPETTLSCRASTWTSSGPRQKSDAEGMPQPAATGPHKAPSPGARSWQPTFASRHRRNQKAHGPGWTPARAERRIVSLQPRVNTAYSTSGKLFLPTANARGERPCASAASTSTPRLASKAKMETDPASAAQCTARCPASSMSAVSAPCLTSQTVAPAARPATACINGVRPFESRMSTSQPVLVTK
mmetsp:Transcript_43657/g.120828  ORF Transcript_43657/g.120828 Transcript_43657/m.120828 type:complete len:210 (-) Transcript_43657:304-933(-)